MATAIWAFDHHHQAIYFINPSWLPPSKIEDSLSHMWIKPSPCRCVLSVSWTRKLAMNQTSSDIWCCKNRSSISSDDFDDHMTTFIAEIQLTFWKCWRSSVACCCNSISISSLLRCLKQSIELITRYSKKSLQRMKINELPPSEFSKIFYSLPFLLTFVPLSTLFRSMFPQSHGNDDTVSL